MIRKPTLSFHINSLRQDYILCDRMSKIFYFSLFDHPRRMNLKVSQNNRPISGNTLKLAGNSSKYCIFRLQSIDPYWRNTPNLLCRNLRQWAQAPSKWLVWKAFSSKTSSRIMKNWRNVETKAPNFKSFLGENSASKRRI